MKKTTSLIHVFALALFIWSCSKQDAGLSSPQQKKSLVSQREGISLKSDDLIGIWIPKEYNSGVSVYGKISTLEADQSGYILKADGKAIYKGIVKASCGVDAKMSNFDCTWSLGKGILSINGVPYVDGKTIEKWEIIAFTDGSFSAKRILSNSLE